MAQALASCDLALLSATRGPELLGLDSATGSAGEWQLQSQQCSSAATTALHSPHGAKRCRPSPTTATKA